MPAEAADVRNVDHRVEADLPLNADARVVHPHRRVAAIERLVDVGNTLEVADLQVRGRAPVELLRIEDLGWIARRIAENAGSVPRVEILAESAAQHRLMMAGEIPGEAKPRRRQNALVIDEACRISRSTGLHDAVIQIARAGHQKSNELRGFERTRGTGRIDGHAVALRVEARTIERRRLRGIVARGHERGRVVADRNLGQARRKANTEIERQARRHSPGILHVPLENARQRRVGGTRRRLGVGLKVSEERVGIGIAGVARVRGGRAEVEAPGEVGAAGVILVVHGPLCLDTGLELVLAPQFADAVGPAPRVGFV